MGKTVAFQYCVRETGNPQDSPNILGTWGWEGQWDFSDVCGRLGILGTSLPTWGLGDGKDSGISVLCEGDWESLGLPYRPGEWEGQWEFSAM